MLIDDNYGAFDMQLRDNNTEKFGDCITFSF